LDIGHLGSIDSSP